MNRLLRSHLGYSFIEVLISLIIFLTGIVAILNFFPVSLKSAGRAEELTQAVFLAQQKAEEIRRDNDAASDTINAIRVLTTPSEPMVFPQDDRFTYSFCGRSVLDGVDDPNDTRDDFFVPRIIIRYNPKYNASSDVVYELRFDQ